jgi:hypothetical protein
MSENLMPPASPSPRQVSTRIQDHGQAGAQLLLCGWRVLNSPATAVSSSAWVALPILIHLTVNLRRAGRRAELKAM